MFVFKALQLFVESVHGTMYLVYYENNFITQTAVFYRDFWPWEKP